MIEKYSHEEHFDRLKKWLDHYEIVMPAKDLMYDIGFCVDEIAIGFLVTTNSKHYFIDHVAADPGATKTQREIALGKLFKAIQDEAEELGAHMISGLAVLPAMKSRFESLGYVRHGTYDLYFKGLGGI